MKRLLIASAQGGAAKTTTALRLAEAWRRQGRTASVAELSPWPTAQLMRADDTLPVRALAEPSTEAAARAHLKPLSADAVVLDAARLDDPGLAHWARCCDAVLLCTRCDAHGLGALKGAWPLLEELREWNPDLEFLGFLPVLLREEDAAGYSRLLRSARGYVVEHPIPFDPAEARRSQRACFAGQDPLPASMDRGSLAAYEAVADFVAKRLQLPDPKPVEAPKEQALFTRLWRRAATTVRRVSVAEGATA